MKKHTKVKPLLKAAAGPCTQDARNLFYLYRGEPFYGTFMKRALVALGRERERSLRKAGL